MSDLKSSEPSGPLENLANIVSEFRAEIEDLSCAEYCMTHAVDKLYELHCWLSRGVAEYQKQNEKPRLLVPKGRILEP